MNSHRRNSLISAWLPVIVWLAIIALESTSMLSSTNTQGILQRVITFFLGPLDRHFIEIANAVLRKTGHFVGYAILSLLVFRALVRSVPVLGLRRLYFRWLAVCSVLLTACVASLDELHQVFLSSRTGKFHDVLLDTAGAVFVQLILVVVGRRRSTPRATAQSVNKNSTSLDVDLSGCPAGSGRTHGDAAGV